jgi:hypothetical protein
MAGLASLAIASTSLAQTTNTIRITGSTAYRASVYAAIGHILNPGYVYGYTGSSASGAGQAEFRGTTISGSYPVDIKTSFSGSVGGIQTVTQNLLLTNWLNSSSLAVGPYPSGGTSGLTGPYDAPTAADVTMSDSFQSSTLFPSPALSGPLNAYGIVGVVPFEICRNAGSPSSISNVTGLVMQALLSDGNIPMSQFTGNSNDESTVVYALGRDEDSGTRLETFAETGFGIFSIPSQWEPVISGTPGPGGTVTGIIPYPADTVNGIPYPAGQAGYNSGGSLASAMNTPGSFGAFTGYCIAYLGINDANTISLGASCTFNGVYYSTNALAEGQYTLWSYEHMYYRSTFNGTPATIVQQLANQIHSQDATVSGGVLVNTMHVSRPVEGGVITFGNPY